MDVSIIILHLGFFVTSDLCASDRRENPGFEFQFQRILEFVVVLESELYAPNGNFYLHFVFNTQYFDHVYDGIYLTSLAKETCGVFWKSENATLHFCFVLFLTKNCARHVNTRLLRVVKLIPRDTITFQQLKINNVRLRASKSRGCRATKSRHKLVNKAGEKQPGPSN